MKSKLSAKEYRELLIKIGLNKSTRKRTPDTFPNLFGCAMKLKLSDYDDARVFILPHSPGLNGKEGLMRMHWSRKKYKMNQLIQYASLQLDKRGYDGFTKVYYMRVYPRKTSMDDDNLLASFKLIGDALEKIGVVENDRDFDVTPFVVKAKGIKCTVVVLLQHSDKERALQIFDEVCSALSHCVGVV